MQWELFFNCRYVKGLFFPNRVFVVVMCDRVLNGDLLLPLDKRFPLNAVDNLKGWEPLDLFQDLNAI